MGTDSIIDRTNRFYLEISRKLLSQREYDILCQLLLDKQPIGEVATRFDISRQRIYQIYRTAYDKAKDAATILEEIACYKEIGDRLISQAAHCGAIMAGAPEAMLKLGTPLFDSLFPFSRRMINMLRYLEVDTIGQLAAIPLQSLENFKGFKNRCKREMIAFIEFEGIESLFDGFDRWKQESTG